jgi:hypothetical protein
MVGAHGEGAIHPIDAGAVLGLGDPGTAPAAREDVRGYRARPAALGWRRHHPGQVGLSEKFAERWRDRAGRLRHDLPDHCPLRAGSRYGGRAHSEIGEQSGCHGALFQATRREAGH